MKKLLIAFVICVFLAAMPAQVLAVEENGIISTEKQIEIPPGMEEEWGNFKEKYGDAFTSVEWDFGCACVRELYGYYDTGRGELKSEADAKVLSKDFLTENAGLFKIDIGQLKFKQVDDWMVDYEQYYGDIPVYRGEVRVVMNGNAVIKDVLNDFYPGINISIEWKIGKVEAVGIVLKQVDVDLSAVEAPLAVDKTDLYIVPKNKDGDLNYYLTWRVPTHSALYFVDTVNGEIIYKQSTVAANGGVEARDAVKDDTGVPTPAQTEAPSNSHSTILVGLAALAIATTLIIIWRLKK